MSENTIRYISEEELIKRGLDALMASLGPVDTTRFLAISHETRMESVMRHQQWQDGLDKDTFFEQVFSEE
jgi:transposase-like protein